MCGFAGVVAYEGRFRITREMLTRMSARIAHRGPDGEGIYLSHEDAASPEHPQVGLVHRRLAILDPDPRANQPFTDHQGRWIVFNGEIYNFRELRRELGALKPDYAWRTDCDTEVLLLAFDAWGTQCVDHLNGMFAFAVWDERARKLFLARDRMGQKPLYVAVDPDDGFILFASEIGPLLVADWKSIHEISELRLDDYLRWGYLPRGLTPYTNITQLAPGCWQSRGHCKQDHSEGRYFDPNVPSGTAARPGETPALTTRRLVSEAVRRQLVADVPLGCFLSGGIDSSVIAAAMKAAVPGDQPVMTFSIGFDDPRYDETKYAARVAAHLGTEHHTFVVKPDAAADLPKLAAVFGEPFGDSSALPTHYLARETRRHVKVALSGDGGDELFGGYDRYRAMAIASQFSALPSALRTLITARLWQALPGVHPKSRITRLKRLLATLATKPGPRYASLVQLFDEPTIAKLTGRKRAGDDSDWIESQFDRLRATRDDVEAALAVDRVTYLPEDLLTKVDRAAMLHALEVRSPFMDHELVHFAASLKSSQLFGSGPKRLLREAFTPDLPAWVFKRRKMGFAVPIGEWFRGELREMLRDSLFAADSFASTHFNRRAMEKLVEEHESQTTDHAQRLYALLMLELWWRTQNGPSPAR